MISDPRATLAPVRAEFERQGFAVARQVLAPAHLDALRRHAFRASLLLLGRLGRMDLAGRLASRSIERDLVDLERELPGFSVWATINPFLTHDLLEVALSAPLRALAAAVLGPGRLSLHPFMAMRCKVPGQALHDVPWHQDSAYLRSLDGVGSIVTMWIPCVATSPVNGGLQLSPSDARNSHELAHVPSVDETGSWYLKLDALPHGCAAHAVCTEPGDVVLFRHNVPHRSVPNGSSSTRLSFDMRYHLSGTANGTTQPSLDIPVGAPDLAGVLPDDALRLIEVSRVRSFGYEPRALPVEPPWFDRWRPARQAIAS